MEDLAVPISCCESKFKEMVCEVTTAFAPILSHTCIAPESSEHAGHAITANAHACTVVASIHLSGMKGRRKNPQSSHQGVRLR
jgi:hypothetical protein